MPGFDQLNDIPEERRAALLREIRALRAREGLVGPAVPGTGAHREAGPLKPAIIRLGHPHKRKSRLRRGLAIVFGAAALATAGTMLPARPAGHDARPPAQPSPGISLIPGQGTAPATPSPAPVTITTQTAGIGCPDDGCDGGGD
jgi:hypothetical protein